MRHPTLLMTLGDVAGIGPEIVVKAWPSLFPASRPVVVGDEAVVRDAAALWQPNLRVVRVNSVSEAAPDEGTLPVLQATGRNLSGVRPGAVSAEAGGAAYDFLVRAIDLTLAGEAGGIVTAPLHKEGLRAAGVPQPGHTEILAERTGAKSHAMLLYDAELSLAVAHVTLHAALSEVAPLVTAEGVLAKIRLLNELMPRLTGLPARIGVAALNPHASDGGLFGAEERDIITPAVEAANAEGIFAVGPFAADAIFLPHMREKFDGIVVMYHDQGHIPMKLLGGRRAVNVTAGLPIVRTSVAHGTAYDIAGQGFADPSSLVSAVNVAAKLCRGGAG